MSRPDVAAGVPAPAATVDTVIPAGSIRVGDAVDLGPAYRDFHPGAQPRWWHAAQERTFTVNRVEPTNALHVRLHTDATPGAGDGPVFNLPIHYGVLVYRHTDTTQEDRP